MRTFLGILAASLTSLVAPFLLLGIVVGPLGFNLTALILVLPFVFAFLVVYHGLGALAVRFVPAHPAVVFLTLSVFGIALCALLFRLSGETLTGLHAIGTAAIGWAALALGSAVHYAVSFRHRQRTG